MAEPGPARALIEAVFDEALDVPANRRAAWLAARCGGDEALRMEVEALLGALTQPEALLDRGAAPFARFAATVMTPAPESRDFGPYRVLRELGRGGMGVVLLAERDDGHFRRRVALKVLLPGAQRDTIHTRFVAERQILASLSHPNIAQLLDGGTTPDGAPFLVMEYVDGVPITEYCRAAGLSVEARLRLFLGVCAAVHHAHCNLVLHRDVKPSNILVTPDGVVKLLDFGIAKLLAPSDGLGEPLTRTDGRPMTPAYASPEQLRGESLTTASDVYSLGLVLYQLLTGSPAFPENGSPANPYRLLVEREAGPERPSQRAGREGRSLRGDLDAIVLMALRHEPDRRYGSVDLLSADLERFLEGFPVRAHRGSTGYRLRRFIRRNTLSVAMGTAAVTAIVGGAAAAVSQMRRAERARALAETAHREADAVQEYLIGMFEPADPAEGRRDTVAAVDLVRRGLARAEKLHDEPLAQAQLLDALSRVQENLGDVAASRALLERALAARERALGPLDDMTTATQQRVAQLRRLTGAYAAAESMALRALEGRTRAGSAAGRAASLQQLGMLVVYRDDLVGAESLFTAAIQERRAIAGDDSLVVSGLQALAALQWRRGRVDAGIATLRQAAASARAHFGRPHVVVATVNLRLAEMLQAQSGASVEADSLARDAVDEAGRAAGEWNRWTALTLDGAARVLRPRPGLPDALDFLARAVEIEHRIMPANDPQIAFTLLGYAARLHQVGRRADGEQARREAVAIAARAYGPRHPAFATILFESAQMQFDWRALEAAARDYERARQIRVAAFGATALVTARCVHGLARVAVARGEVRDARRYLADARAIYVERLGASHPDVQALDAERGRLDALSSSRPVSRTPR